MEEREKCHSSYCNRQFRKTDDRPTDEELDGRSISRCAQRAIVEAKQTFVEVSHRMGD
jgi:hypothetical protein